MTKQKCSFCGKRIKGKIGYYKRKPTCRQCLIDKQWKWWKEKYLSKNENKI